MNQKAFTLIELLVTMAIIAILSGVVLTTASIVQKNGRDTQRKADLKKVQSALQQYYSDKFVYPLKANLSFDGTPFTKPSTTFNYLNKTPIDPTNVHPYEYEPWPSGCNNTTSRCTNYCLYAVLEYQKDQFLENDTNVYCPAKVHSSVTYNLEMNAVQ